MKKAKITMTRPLETVGCETTKLANNTYRVSLKNHQAGIYGVPAILDSPLTIFELNFADNTDDLSSEDMNNIFLTLLLAPKHEFYYVRWSRDVITFAYNRPNTASIDAVLSKQRQYMQWLAFIKKHTGAKHLHPFLRVRKVGEGVVLKVDQRRRHYCLLIQGRRTNPNPF